MTLLKVGVQLWPQHADIATLRAAWRRAEDMGLDSVWIWDHFFPLSGPADGEHYECWSLLGAMSVDTDRVQFGALVSSNSYRNPDLLADMARTVNLLSDRGAGGRLVLGIGGGWNERDHDEYGYPFEGVGDRLRSLADALPRIRSRLAKLVPPTPDLPILIGGDGEKVTLRLVAQYANLWNGFGPPERFAQRVAVLDEWCATVGRDPREIERTVTVGPDEVGRFREFVAAGATHLIVSVAAPYDMSNLEERLAEREPALD